MPLDFRKLDQEVKRTQVQCLFNHLAAGLTFAGLARKAEGEDRTKVRSRARTAYNSACRFVGRVTMTCDEAQRIRRDMETLKKRLQELGETFRS